MKLKKLKWSVLLLGLGLTAQAQQTTAASGGNASGSGGSVAYSVGQVVYTTNTGSTGSVAQGVQHTYEIYNLGINDPTLNMSVVVFPNPTTDAVTLQISNYNNEKFSYQLFDLQGRLLSNYPIAAQQTQIKMNSLPDATYFLNVLNQVNQKVQSFKIIKKQN